MANSIDFNSTDMSTHNLRITSPGMNVVSQLVRHIQLQEEGYSFRPMREPRRIRMEFIVTNTSLANLDANLDSIKRLLTQTEPKQLIFDSLTTRYFNAMLESFDGEYIGFSFKGVMSFICPDPLGYDVTEENNDHNIDADPKTVNEVTSGGTAIIEPVITLTAGEVLSVVTVTIESVLTGEILEWVGSLGDGEALEIDSANWTVKKSGVDDMSGVSGQFPRLNPEATNQITVSGFSNTGVMNLTYRDTFR